MTGTLFRISIDMSKCQTNERREIFLKLFSVHLKCGCHSGLRGCCEQLQLASRAPSRSVLQCHSVSTRKQPQDDRRENPHGVDQAQIQDLHL